MRPTVSVVMPAYNAERHLRTCMDSVLAQTFRDFEFLILDDGSSDATRAIVESYDDPRIRFLPMTHVGRNGVVCNTGLRLARGRYVARMDADDAWEPAKLARQVAFLDEHPEVGVVFTHVQVIDGEGRPLTDHPLPFNAEVPAAEIGRRLLAGNFLCNPSAMLRKAVVDHLGGYHPLLRTVADWELWLRIAPHYGLHVIPEPLTRYRWHGANVSKTTTAEEGRRCVTFARTMAGMVAALPARLGTAPRDSVVVVAYNSMSTLGKCLIGAVQAAPPEGLELILVDNGSADDTPQLLRYLEHALAAGPVRLRVVLNLANEGFTHACNQGIALATGDRVLLLNPDAQLFPGAIARMRAHFAAGVGAVGPTSDYVAGAQKFGRYVDPSLLGSSMAASAVDQALAGRNAGKGVETRMLVGFCLMLARQAIERVGPLDDALFLGNDDLEYSWRLREHGYRLLVASDVFAHHRGQVSFKTREKAHVDQLVQDSTDMLAAKLKAYYGAGRVPLPRALWGHDWFRPSPAVLDWAVPPPPPDAPEASIVVLTLNQLAITRRCFESLFAHVGPSFELIVVDNGSADGTPAYLAELAARDPRVRVIANERNLGFPHGCNQGLAIARGRTMVLLNNDTVLTDGWLEGLLAPMRRDATIGAVGPRTNRIVGRQQIDDVPYGEPDLAGLPAFAAARRERLAGAGTFARRLIGFCVAIRRAAMLAVGGLDPRFGTGNFEDDDYGLRLQVAGYRLWIAEDVFVHHWGSQTFRAEKIDHAALIRTNYRLFAEKWGLPPGASGSYDPQPLTMLPFKRERDYVPLPGRE